MVQRILRAPPLERDPSLEAPRGCRVLTRALAPGFQSLIKGRHVFTPGLLEQEDRNLFGGAINGGTSQIHQQLIFRPVPGWGRPETPVAGLFLASASAHPGGGVHGGPGANAAQAALLPLPRMRSRLFGNGS